MSTTSLRTILKIKTAQGIWKAEKKLSSVCPLLFSYFFVGEITLNIYIFFYFKIDIQLLYVLNKMAFTS